jgi:thiamine pyrophosphokinase
MSERIVIVAGGTLGSWAEEWIREGDTLVGADRGALFLVRRGFRPAIALGDFDSVTEEEKEEIRRGSDCFSDCDPVRKDWTDTELAFDWALKRNPREVVLLGALGTRFDHSFANVQLMIRAAERGIECRIADAVNEIRLLSGPAKAALAKGRYTHVSLLPLSAEASGITLAGFRYPLKDAVLKAGQTLGVSNVITDSEAMVTVGQGMLLVIQTAEQGLG